MENLFIVKEIPDSAITEVVANAYGFVPESLEILPGGMESAAWLVQTYAKAFVLKVFGLHEGSKDYIKSEVDLYKALRTEGI